MDEKGGVSNIRRQEGVRETKGGHHPRVTQQYLDCVFAYS